MKTFRRSLCLLTFVGATALAQVPAPSAAPAPAVPEATPPIGALRSEAQLEQLLAPIALYPDALIALILPASTVSTDIVLAARHLRDFPGDRSQIEHRAWDESVKSLTYYPEVLKWMDENLSWTKQVGEAFVQQPADVMQAVQRLRTRARAAGTLVDTPQQQVLAEPDVIRIVPAQPDVIYVPRYEPDVVFLPSPVYYTAPVLSFGLGVRTGSWLAYDCDWRRKTIWMGDRHRSWRGHDWRRPLVPIAPGFKHVSSPGVRQWCPPPRTSRPSHFAITHRTTEIIRPTRFGSTPVRHHDSRSFSSHDRRPSSPPPHRVIVPAARTPVSPAHSHATTRTFSPGSRSTVTSHRAPSSTRLYVTDPGGASRSSAASITPPAATVRTPGQWQRGRDSRTSISIARPPAPLQPAMGPHLTPRAPSPAAHTGSRFISRPSNRGSTHTYSGRTPAPISPPTAARAATPARAPVASVQPASSSRSAPVHSQQHRGNSHRGGPRGYGHER